MDNYLYSLKKNKKQSLLVLGKERDNCMFFVWIELKKTCI